MSRSGHSVLRVLLRNIPANIARFDRSLRRIRLHRDAEAVVGSLSEAFVGAAEGESVVPADLATRWTESLRAAFESGTAQTLTYAWPTSLGDRYYETRIVPEPSPGGGVKTVLTITHDVTDRLGEQRSEHASGIQPGLGDEIGAAVLDALPATIAVLDGQGVIVGVNNGWRDFANASWPSHVNYGIGSRYLEACDAGARAGDALAEAAATGMRDVLARRSQYFALEYPCHAPNRQMWFRLIAAPFPQDRGAVALHVEITERKRAEEALQTARERLVHAERLASIGTLAAGIAHEINNPVQAMLSAARAGQLSKGQPNHDEVVGHALALVVRQAERCGRIVKGVLQFARQQPMQKWPTDPHEIVSRAVERSRAYAESNQATLTLNVDGSLPSVRVNPIGLEQALINLIRNAIEASQTPVRVTITTSRVRDAIRFTVEDDGSGISEAQRRRVFDPFYTRWEEEGRAGLGLSVSHGIVSDHGGRIDVRDRPDGGTIVWTDLPLPSGGDDPDVPTSNEAD